MPFVLESSPELSRDTELFLPSDFEAPDLLPAAEKEALQKTYDWVSTYPVQRVVKQDRTEAICPFVAPSLKREAMVFSIAEPESPDSIDSIDQELRHYTKIFHMLEPKKEPANLLKTVVAIFPDTRGQLMIDATDPKRDLKGDLLEENILVGEFFPTCPFASTFNKKLFALRSPVPMYVLRTFIETDWTFIAGVDRWKEIYRKRFGEPPEDLKHVGTLRGRIMGKVRALVDGITKR